MMDAKDEDSKVSSGVEAPKLKLSGGKGNGFAKLTAFLTTWQMILIYMFGAAKAGYEYGTHRAESEIRELRTSNDVLSLQFKTEDFRLRTNATLRVKALRALADHGLSIDSRYDNPFTLAEVEPEDRFFTHSVVYTHYGVNSMLVASNLMLGLRQGLAPLVFGNSRTNITIRGSGRGTITYSEAALMTGYSHKDIGFAITNATIKSFELHHTTNGIVWIHGFIDEQSAIEISPFPSDPRMIVLYPQPFGTNNVLARISLGMVEDLGPFTEPFNKGALKLTVIRRRAD